MTGYVFFATCRGMRDLKRLHWLAGVLIRVLTASIHDHCIFGYDGVVVDPRMARTSFWPLLEVPHRYPGLTAFAVVKMSYGVDLDAIPGGPCRRPWWPTIRRWLCQGCGPWLDDCIGNVLICLAAGGLNPPRRIVSPVTLLRWLKSQGCVVIQRKDFPDEQRFRIAVTDLCVAGST